MTINQAYLQYLNIVNRNLTNNRINVDQARFILLYNAVAKRYVEWVLEKKNEDEIRNIQILLVPDKNLQKTGTNNSSESYSLPKDYFDFSNLQVFARKEKCKNERLATFEVKSDDTEELWSDSNNKPSFEWRETFYFLAGGKVKIFRTDFSIDRALLTYYRYPKKVDIEGYINEEGQASQNIDPEFDDKVVERILLGMAKQFSAINTDQASYSMEKDMLFSEVFK